MAEEERLQKGPSLMGRLSGYESGQRLPRRPFRQLLKGLAVPTIAQRLQQTPVKCLLRPHHGGVTGKGRSLAQKAPLSLLLQHRADTLEVWGPVPDAGSRVLSRRMPGQQQRLYGELQQALQRHGRHGLPVQGAGSALAPASPGHVQDYLVIRRVPVMAVKTPVPGMDMDLDIPAEQPAIPVRQDSLPKIRPVVSVGPAGKNDLVCPAVVGGKRAGRQALLPPEAVQQGLSGDGGASSPRPWLISRRRCEGGSSMKRWRGLAWLSPPLCLEASCGWRSHTRTPPARRSC